MCVAPLACAIVQARMGSSRYPGKVLAPLRGIPILRHIIDRIREYKENIDIVIATSDRESDLPIAAYAKEIGLRVVRGSETDVVSRILSAITRYRYDYFFRVCADSPLLDSALLREAEARALEGNWDLVTNVYPRTFPRGMSVELIKTETFIAASDRMRSAHEREHITSYFYANSSSFRIYNIALNSSLAEISYAIDTLEDLARIEQILQSPSGPLRYDPLLRSLV